MSGTRPAGADTPSAGGATIDVSVNGERRTVPAGISLDAVIAALTGRGAGAGVAAAVNETVVPRGAWPVTDLRDGDRVEVLTATSGG